jgi:hypothetical protein
MVPTFVRLFDKKIVTISLVDSTSHSLSCGGLYIKFFAGEYTERNMVLACSPLNLITYQFLPPAKSRQGKVILQAPLQST